MAYRRTGPERPHKVTVLLSDEEFETLEHLRGTGTRTAYIRALLSMAKENPDSAPMVHKHTWKKNRTPPVGFDKRTNRPLFKFACVCGAHKVGAWWSSANSL